MGIGGGRLAARRRRDETLVLQLRAEEFHLASHLLHFLLVHVVTRAHFGCQGVKGGSVSQRVRERREHVDRMLLGLLLRLSCLLLLQRLLRDLLLLLLLLHTLLLRRALMLLLLSLLLLLLLLLLPLLLLLL